MTQVAPKEVEPLVADSARLFRRQPRSIDINAVAHAEFRAKPMADPKAEHARLTRMFMPIGREYVAGRIAAGENHPDFEHEARLWAGHHAIEAMNHPERAAAAAIAFCARCVAHELGEDE